MVQDKKRSVDGVNDKMNGAYLGPEFDDTEIEAYLQHHGYSATKVDDETQRARHIAKLLLDQNTIGLFQGRMEYGPRALGNRAIIGDARSPTMQRIMNLKIKYRESFRPFAPSCLEDRVSDFFELDKPSPYMLLVAQVKASRCKRIDEVQRLTMRAQWIKFCIQVASTVALARLLTPHDYGLTGGLVV